jgi:inosose dehydratase
MKEMETMKAGINVWTWGTGSREPFEQGVKEAADIGYQAVETLGAVMFFYEDAPDEFDTMLATYGVEFACAYHHLTGDWENDFTNAKRILTFLGEHDVPVMNLQAARRPDGGPSDAQLAETADQASQIGEFGKQQGVRVCLHPHYATMVEQEPELVYMMENVDASVLGLTIDTAHTVLGGMDPVDISARYGDRVGYMHMKDILPPSGDDIPWYMNFRELGRGTVNFPAVIANLDAAGFEGVLAVELDRPSICGYKSAAISRAYIKDELGV